MLKRFQQTCICAAAVLAAAGGASAQVSTSILFATVRTSGMVGLTAGQTARLNVLNPGALAPAATAVVCSAQLSFWTDQGTVVKTTSVSVLPGKSVSFNLNRDTDVAAAGERVEIRAVIAYPALSPATTTPPTAVCGLLPTLEVFNNDTGRTQFVVGRFAPVPLALATTPEPE